MKVPVSEESLITLSRTKYSPSNVFTLFFSIGWMIREISGQFTDVQITLMSSLKAMLFFTASRVTSGSVAVVLNHGIPVPSFQRSDDSLPYCFQNSHPHCLTTWSSSTTTRPTLDLKMGSVATLLNSGLFASLGLSNI